MDDEQKKLFKKAPTDSLVLGIGDVAAATGVSKVNYVIGNVKATFKVRQSMMVVIASLPIKH
ncbi:hypothetical protein L3X07_00200 [Levilactobacillus brevis]|nr:hypothetical protein [Levilactobacillus brevis]